MLFLTEEQRQQIAVLWAEGASLRAIRTALGDPPEVSARAVAHYCTTRLPPMPSRRRPRNGARNWTAAQDARLLKMWPKSGPKIIAKSLGKTPTAIALRAKRLGLTRNGDHKWQAKAERERIVAFVESKGGEIRSDALAELTPPLRAKDTRFVLARLARQGHIQRVRPGVFKALERRK